MWNFQLLHVLSNNIVSSDLQGSCVETLIGSGPIVADRTGNDEHFVGTRAHLVPRNTSTKTGSWTKYR